jgi:hypothetical protein
MVAGTIIAKAAGLGIGAWSNGSDERMCRADWACLFPFSGLHFPVFFPLAIS